MQRALAFLVVALLAACCHSAPTPSGEARDAALLALPRVDALTRGADGDVRVLFGNLGRCEQVSEAQVRDWISRNRPLLRLTGTEGFLLRRVESDESQATHFYFDELLRGLPVVGGELFVHVQSDGTVFGVTSNLLADGDDETYNEPLSTRVTAATALRLALDAAGVDSFSHVSDVELKYVIDPDTDLGYFAYYAVVTTNESANAGLLGHEQPIRVYATVKEGKLVYIEPVYLAALTRTIWTADNLERLPGSVVRKEGSSTVNDQTVNQAYSNSGICYDYLKKTFNRDSYNNKGAPLNSTVHYGKKYNNAFWNGQQMVYGDGDGVSFSDFAGDLTVVCHELTHALTSATANLIYKNEPGALNEAMSDVFGASTAIWNKDPSNSGITSKSWQIGPTCFLQGAALRYMNNPPLDGQSRDYFPDRYIGTSDNGGVHINSGIANLAYVLLAGGGVHPNQKTKNFVSGVGVQVAQRIYYTTLTSYMTSTSNFADARSITEQVSKSLYNNPSITNSVSNSWAAVGVGAIPPPLSPAPK